MGEPAQLLTRTEKYTIIIKDLVLDSAFPPSPLGDRPREVFRHLVEAFLASGEPVGSRTLSQRLPVTLSPASIRNVMADLEAMGLLYAPHTSAGRVPTERGLRLFVDGMLEIGDLTTAERDTLEEAHAEAQAPGSDNQRKGHCLGHLAGVEVLAQGLIKFVATQAFVERQDLPVRTHQEDHGDGPDLEALGHLFLEFPFREGLMPGHLP